MMGWRLSCAIITTNDGNVVSLKLSESKNGRGFKFYRPDGQRPHLRLPLRGFTVTYVKEGETDDRAIDGTVKGDAIVFALPKVIRGGYHGRSCFKITRSD